MLLLSASPHARRPVHWLQLQLRPHGRAAREDRRGLPHCAQRQRARLGCDPPECKGLTAESRLPPPSRDAQPGIVITVAIIACMVCLCHRRRQRTVRGRPPCTREPVMTPLERCAPLTLALGHLRIAPRFRADVRPAAGRHADAAVPGARRLRPDAAAAADVRAAAPGRVCSAWVRPAARVRRAPTLRRAAPAAAVRGVPAAGRRVRSAAAGPTTGLLLSRVQVWRSASGVVRASR